MSGRSFSSRGRFSGGGREHSPDGDSHDLDTDMITRGEEVDVTGKSLIEPDGDGFKSNPTQVVHCIRDAFKSKFEGACPTWKKVPLEVRNMWFEEFKKSYYWHPQHEAKIRANFELKGSNRLRDLFGDIRKHSPNTKPLWLAPQVWNNLKAYWDTDTYKSKRATASANRVLDTGLGSSLHTGGSIPSSEIRRRLEKKEGKEIGVVELFKHTHQKSNNEWVDVTAAQTYENFIPKWQEIQSTQASDGESTTMISDAEAWAKEYTTKKGRIYGLGSEGAKYKNISSSTSSQSTQNTQNWVSPQDFEAIKAKLDKEIQEKEDMKEHMRVQLANMFETVQNCNRAVEQNTKKMKKFMKKSKSKSKSKVSSHSSNAGKGKNHVDDDESSSSD